MIHNIKKNSDPEKQVIKIISETIKLGPDLHLFRGFNVAVEKRTILALKKLKTN